MGLRYRTTRFADQDLVEIWRYIAADNPAAATRLLDDVDKKFAMLARQPLIGEIRDEVRPGLRSFPVGSYVIYYTIDDDETVVVMRVLHGARDSSQMF
jgi:toxin ParE1/3/4